MSMRTFVRGAAAAAVVVGVALVVFVPVAAAQYCGAPGVTAPQCDGQCPAGQMCAESIGTCQCVPALAGCANPSNPNGPPVCWGACPSATQVCQTFAGGCMCVQGPLLCGNGTPDPGEPCEDGNTVDGDGCDSNCTPTACGNGIATTGEACDGIDDAACLAGCQPDCTCTSVPPTPPEIGCFGALGKAGGKFVKGKLKLLQSCKERELRVPGSCPTPELAVVTKLQQQLIDAIAKQCDLGAPVFANMGFPGRCADGNPGDGFTTADLTACMLSSHTAIVDALLDVEYDPTVAGPLPPSSGPCQSALGKGGALVVLGTMKSIQKCRNAILKGKLVGPPADCATFDPKTTAAIGKIRGKAISTIESTCTAFDVVALKACTPDQTTPAGAAACIVATHTDATDNPDPDAPADLIDYEYATPAPASPSCGNDVVDQLAEECDGTDDAACPGSCGAPTGLFACLCQDASHQRLRVIEHAASDLDAGWTGNGHDGGTVEGGGYVTDLWDCDGPGGPDTVCLVGPSCSLPPHSQCTNDAGCVGQGVCRKTRGGATGPHCNIDLQQACTTDLDCTAPGDHCVIVPHGPPMPLADGPIALCIANTFAEDVVGTLDLATGASAVRQRQRWTTHLASDPSQPCPVCGGFCAGTAGVAGPGARNRCTTDADCPSPPNVCVLDSVCSFGPNVDQPCRANPPFGGPTTLFGNPSIDCPHPAGASIGQLDVLFNPATTGATSLTSNVDCTDPGFAGKACVGGVNDGRPCTIAADCAGGTCNEQCFCPGVGGVPQRPNACDAACVGGLLDAQPCLNDSECDPPNGFCHPGDCRENSGDTDSTQEGACTTGPVTARCSLTTYRACAVAGDCAPPACPSCQVGETCDFPPRQCFVNGVTTRNGTPGAPSRTTVATFCMGATSSAIVNTAVGLPGPGAITQPVTSVEVGF